VRASVPTLSQIANRKSQIVNRLAFTLIELLTVIAVIGVLAAAGLSVTKGVKKREYLNTATAEMNQIQTALDNYKAKYGVYPPSNANLTPLVNTLYYELSGVTHNTVNKTYTTLDSACTISEGNYTAAFTMGASSIGGIINCSSGSAEEGTTAQNFLSGLKANRFGSSSVTGLITNLITSVRGPDGNYKPLGVVDANPFRYLYPGTNNPSSYDLWIQLVINGKTNLICNWTKAVQINSPLP